ncbi:MAG: hypothetical protein WCH79_03950 [Planctomycetia bacterium]
MSALILAIGLLGCTGAEASCGDWLVGHHRSAAAHDAIVADGEAGGPVSPRPADAPRLPQCDGPACRGVPFMPGLPRDVSADAPRHDPADRVAVAALCCRDVGRPFLAANDRQPLAVIAAVPIRPPRRASLQA